MADALQDACAHADQSTVLDQFGLAQRDYLLATVHRAENTDDPLRLAAIMQGMADTGRRVLFPVHPRTRQAIARAGLVMPANVLACDPLGYLDLVRALRDADLVLTDSGGLQKEAYWLAVPCVTLRDETEWRETVEQGWNHLAGADRGQIAAAVQRARRLNHRTTLYGGDGRASARIKAEIEGMVWA